MPNNMEQVFFRLHVRFTTTVTRLLSPGVRKWMEYLSLAHAFALALVLVKLQSRFVNQKHHCLSRYFNSQGLDPWDNEVLQLRIVRRKYRGLGSRQCTQKGEPSWPFYEAPGGEEGSRCWVGPDSCFLPSEYGVERSYLFSFEKGFLMLRQQLRDDHAIRSLNVTVDAQCRECFGGTATQLLLHHLIGFDTVVMNWLVSVYGGHGYLYTTQSKELFNLNYAAELMASAESWQRYAVFKAGVVLTTLFLFFTTTTLVSFTLRETQERMLKFTYLLQHYVRNRLPYGPLVLTHVVESLVFVPIMVGILLFLSEFFSDQLLAFMVLSMVWAAEVYSVITVRTPICVRFFPRLFFAYFVLFHIYFFSFPFGFSYLALISIVTFLQHSMLFFWNRYEVPALQSGHVSAENPRPAGVIITGPSIEELLLARPSHPHDSELADLAMDNDEAIAEIRRRISPAHRLPTPPGTDASQSSMHWPALLGASGPLPSTSPVPFLDPLGPSPSSSEPSPQPRRRPPRHSRQPMERGEGGGEGPDDHRSSTPSPPSPYSMFFTSHHNAPTSLMGGGLRGGPYAARYEDQAALLEAATRAALLQQRQAQAMGQPLVLSPSSLSASQLGQRTGLHSGESSSEDLTALDALLLGHGGRVFVSATPSPLPNFHDPPLAAGLPPCSTAQGLRQSTPSAFSASSTLSLAAPPLQPGAVSPPSLPSPSPSLLGGDEKGGVSASAFS